MGFTNKELDQISAAAKEVQAIEDEYLEKESWQAIRELFENAETNTKNMLEYLEEELLQAIIELFENAESDTNDLLIIEDGEVRSAQAEKSVVLPPSSTYRTSKTLQGDKMSKVEQKTVCITKQSEGGCLESSKS